MLSLVNHPHLTPQQINVIYSNRMIQSYEVIILVHSLKNIYLTSKGLYTAKLTLYQDPSPLAPSNLVPPSMLFKQEFSEQRQFVSGKAQIRNESYLSEKVEMKLMDQEANLFDIIEYKISPDVPNNQQGITLICKGEESSVVFDSKIRIKSLKQGICEYIEIPFENNHQISLNLCLFSILVSTKLADDAQNQPQKTTKKPSQSFRSILKQTRYHSFISQQKLSRLCSSDKLQELSEKRDKSREYFYPNRSITREECELSLQAVCSSNYTFLKKFLEVLIFNEICLIELVSSYNNQRKQKYTDFVFLRKELNEGVDSRVKCARRIRKSSNYQSIARRILPIQIEGEFSAAIQHQPVAFYEITQIAPVLLTETKPQKLKNIYIFCHGFQGSPLDLVLLRNNYKCFDPNAEFFLARSYEEEFDNNLTILEMGLKLAYEILGFMKVENLKPELTKLNFICFSMGGLIARASFVHLKEMNFGRYTSICTPHLGCIQSGTLVQIGLFMLKNVLKYRCITQLCISDNKNIEQSTIFKLSQQGSLNIFQDVVIVSNNKDTFVPWESARIEPIGGKIKKVEDEMISNILNSEAKLKKVHRLDFDTSEPRSSSIYKAKEILEDAIGRTAHVEFIKNDIMIRMMLNTIPIRL